MSIHSLLQGKPFGPDEIAVLVAAYEATLEKLGLTQRDDAFTRLVAKKIIDLAERGVRDLEQLTDHAMRELRMD
jgi:hypothetical protein